MTTSHHPLALFAVLASIPAASMAADSSPSNLPEGLSSSDWSGIRAAHESARHAVSPNKNGTWTARNPGQQWQTVFDGRGFTTTPDSGGWSWGFDLKCYGFGSAMKSTGDKATVSHGCGRVSYQWDGNLSEWFINDSRGMEQGWTFQHRPEGAQDDLPLHLDLKVRGGLVPRVSEDGATVSFMGSIGSVLNYGGLKAWDADGKKLAVRFVPVDTNRIRVMVEEQDARYPVMIDPVARQATLQAADPDNGDFFGFSVAAAGDTVVVGAYEEDSDETGVNGNQADDSARGSGAAYIFVRNGTAWSQQAYLKASYADGFAFNGDLFGYSVAISGDTVVVGAIGEDSNATGVNGNQADNSASGSGAAYVFVRSGSTWSQQAYLKPPTDSLGYKNSDDHFGRSVAVSGDTVVVGSPDEDSSTTGVDGQRNEGAANSGAAYVFFRTETLWTQQASLKASNTGSGDQFGCSVAVSGDTVVVGAYTESSKATGVNGNQTNDLSYGAGAAYVFVRGGGTWTQQAYLKASNTDSTTVISGDYFGFAVAVSGETAVVGAYLEDSNATGVNGNQADNSAGYAGAAYVFARSGTTWSQQAYLKPSPNIEGFNNGGMKFGRSVAIGEGKVVVGALRDAYVFTSNGSTWKEQARIKDPVDAVTNFGGSVAIAGSTVVIGSWSNDAGTADVFDLDAVTPKAPEIVVSQPGGTRLVDGSATTSFGTVKVGRKGAGKSFTIKNTGNADLTGLSLTKNGKHAKDFTVKFSAKTTLARGESTTFSVIFEPGAKGPRQAAIHLKSNDADESPFDIKLTGTGAK